MGSRKRAWLYIMRNKGKSIILFGIIWVCLLSSMIAVILQDNINSVVTQLKETMRGYFTIVPYGEADEVSEILTDSFCESMKEDDNITTYNGTDRYYMSLPDIKLTPGSFASQGNEAEAQVVQFISCTDSTYNELFYLGELVLKDGEHITEDDEGKVLISDVLAKDNNLDIGDQFTGVITEGYQGLNDQLIGEKYSYSVKGIYHVKNPEEGVGEKVERNIQNNCIYVDTKTDRKILSRQRNAQTDWYRYGVNFYLRDSQQFEKTLARVKEKIKVNDNMYRVEQNNGKYEKSAEPLEKFVFITKIFIVTMIILSIVILSLILVMWMKDRKREIGIYLSMGLSKKEILSQVILESFSLYCLSLMASLLCVEGVLKTAGMALITDMIGETLLLPEMHLEMAKLIAVSIGGCVVILIAVLISFVSITRLKPKEILVANE